MLLHLQFEPLSPRLIPISCIGITVSFQPDQELALDSALSVSSPLIDCERTVGLLLGLNACHLAHSTPITAEEDENENWLTSDFFSGGMETPAVSVDNVGRFVCYEDIEHWEKSIFSPFLSIELSRLYSTEKKKSASNDAD